MSCLDAKISLVPKHQLIVPLTFLARDTAALTQIEVMGSNPVEVLKFFFSVGGGGGYLQLLKLQ